MVEASVQKLINKIYRKSYIAEDWGLPRVVSMEDVKKILKKLIKNKEVK